MSEHVSDHPSDRRPYEPEESAGGKRFEQDKRDDIRAHQVRASKDSRVGQRRLEQLATELTDRDRAIISTLARLHLATGSQLVRAHWSAASEADLRAARRTLKRLVEWRMVARLERRLGGLGRGSDSYTYALDTAAQRLLRLDGSARRPHLPRPAMWAHALQVAEIYVQLVESLRGTDRRLASWDGEPACWRNFAGAYGEVVRVKPDGFVRISGPGYQDIYFVEADTGSQSRTVIRAKLDVYRRYAASGGEQSREGGVFPQVVFITTTAARHALLVDVIGTLPTEWWRLFAVGLVADTARLLGGEVTS
jgi:hypothetical protein